MYSVVAKIVSKKQSFVLAMFSGFRQVTKYLWMKSCFQFLYDQHFVPHEEPGAQLMK